MINIQDLEAECRGEPDCGHVGLSLHSVPNPLARHRWLRSDANTNGERHSRNVRQHKYTTAQTFSHPCRAFPRTWDFSLLKIFILHFTLKVDGLQCTFCTILKYILRCFYPGLLWRHTRVPSPDPPWRWCHTARVNEPGTPGHYTNLTRPEGHSCHHGGINESHHIRKYNATALSLPDHFLQQFAFGKFDTNQSQVLKYKIWSSELVCYYSVVLLVKRVEQNKTRCKTYLASSHIVY